MKLKESIPSNSFKIIELYNKVESGSLDTSPEFQRKLVWKKQHKYAFISTILLNYPFPEIYIASIDMDVDNLKAQEIVVDGKQRISAIVDYIKGENHFKNTSKVKPFSELSLPEKKDFLNYSVTVRDLKNLSMETIKEVFERINSTDYSLNTNERLNARYGDGEFSMFCKQLADTSFNPSEDQTDIVIQSDIKLNINTFFDSNQIFSDNDKSRMFDAQFLMLIASTILEGAYFSRSIAINKYLEEYNSSFSEYATVLEKIQNSISIIQKLKLSLGSYWYNKANLFILIIELSKVNVHDINTENLERVLLDFEKKSEIYFTDEDISGISEDERKYFEFARQGSNELAARMHRGRQIASFISESLFNNITEESATEKVNIEYFKNTNTPYVVICPTETSLRKGIIDATSTVREFLKANNVHDFETQELGSDKKIVKDAVIFDAQGKSSDTHISFYRATGRGDYRLWVSNLNQIAVPNEKIVFALIEKVISVINISKSQFTRIENLPQDK